MGRLTHAEKECITQCILSKIMAYQKLGLLTDDAHQVIEHRSEFYTWKDSSGLGKEMDCLTITAIILQRLCPHHKVDMYSEIGKVKKMTITQYDKDEHLYFDAIQSLKLQIGSNDETAYTDDALFVISLLNSKMKHFKVISSMNSLL